MVGTLYDQLLAIPGIHAAHLEGDGERPRGVRVKLRRGADPDEVGRRVQEVLAAQGMRAEITPPADEPAAVVNLADYEGESELDTDDARVQAAGGGVSAVAVTEDRAGSSVTVHVGDEASATRRAARSVDAVDRAVVDAVAELAGVVVHLVAVADAEIGGTAVVTCVVEDLMGRRSAGAGAVEGSRAFAVAVATWQAVIELSTSPFLDAARRG